MRLGSAPAPAATSRRALAALVTLVASVAVACDDDPSSEGVAARHDGVALSQLAFQLAEAECFAAARCPRGDATLTTKQCDERLAASIQSELLSLLEAGVAEGRIHYDGEATIDCLQAVRGCQSSNHLPAVCRDALKGLVPAEGACRTDFDCAGESHCAGVACPGRCEQLRPATEPCASHTECADGLACLRGICRAPAGERCERSADCAHLLCLASSAPGLAQCVAAADVARSHADKPCGAVATPAAAPLCAAGLACVPTGGGQGICVATATAAADCAGAMPDPCPPSLYCSDATGRCEPLPEANERCAAFATLTATLDRQCAAGLVCQDGLCVASVAKTADRAEDPTCARDVDCPDGDCAW